MSDAVPSAEQSGAINTEDLWELPFFQGSSWTDLFKSFCIPHVLLDLPEEALVFLEDDTIVSSDVPLAVPHSGSVDEDDHDDSSSQHAHHEGFPVPMLEFKQSITDAIQSFGGKVVPKLNWSAPLDAQWVSPTGISCANVDEVLLLLKCSNRATHDIQCIRQLQQQQLLQSRTSCSDEPAGTGNSRPSCNHCVDASTAQPNLRPQLIIKKFLEMDPSMEFRCFVKDRSLIGVSQRDPTQNFPSIHERLQEIKEILQAYHRQTRNLFPLPHFVFDVYITGTGHVKLLDINPLGGTTQPLLFSWEELEQAAVSMQSSEAAVDAESFEIRVVKSSMHIQSSARSVLGVPVDTLDMQGMTWPDIMKSLASEVSRQNLEHG